VATWQSRNDNATSTLLIKDLWRILHSARWGGVGRVSGGRVDSPLWTKLIRSSGESAYEAAPWFTGEIVRRAGLRAGRVDPYRSRLQAPLCPSECSAVAGRAQATPPTARCKAGTSPASPCPR